MAQLLIEVIAMWNVFKNSGFSKVLQVLLIGYFLMSSLNFAAKVSIANSNTDEVYKMESTVLGIFKKIFKCNSVAETFEDCDSESGCGANKIKLTVDYLIPFHGGVCMQYVHKTAGKQSYLSQNNFTESLYTKIHLPPPEISL